MTDTPQDPLNVEAFVDSAVQGESSTGRIVLPLLLNRHPTDAECRISRVKDAVGTLQAHTRRLNLAIHSSTDVKSAVESARRTLAVISSEALKEERRTSADALAGAAESIRTALRDSGLRSAEDDESATELRE